MAKPQRGEVALVTFPLTDARAANAVNTPLGVRPALVLATDVDDVVVAFIAYRDIRSEWVI